MIVSVVIPTFNGRRFLEPCLTALRRVKVPAGVTLQPIVVDNGSTDGTRELLGAFPDVTPVFESRPLGYSRANNAARRTASGDVVCFLNNDTTVEPDWLRRPVEIFAQDPRVAAVGSKLLYLHRYQRIALELPSGARTFVASSVFRGPLDDKVRWSRAGGEAVERGVRGRWIESGGALYVPAPAPGFDDPPESLPVVRLLAVQGAPRLGLRVDLEPVRWLGVLPAVVPLEELSSRAEVRLIQNAGTSISPRGEGSDVGSGEEDAENRYGVEEIVPALCGASMFVRRSALDRAGWFPEIYASYYEDVDLSLRLREALGLLVFCPSSVVNHYHTGTNKEWSPGFIENVARSSLLFVSRYAEPRVVLRSLAERAHHVRHELLHATGSNRWGQMHGTRGIVKAMPGLLQVAAERLAETVRRRSSRARQWQVPRTPYRPQAST